ncbi:MAG TPA: methyltransferase, partial [Longimicrobiales bacterium]|nr:methyltransferase [Longimicrobiales bacterium]
LWAVLGLACGLLGLAVRGWTVGHVPLGTSGRGTKELRAETLNTEGLYSQVRHPLYLGNYFMWIGVAVLAGKPTAILVTTLAFWLYYERIMMAEERFLWERFGDVFGAWASETPPFVPRLRGWRPWPYPFSFRFVLGRDYQALYGFVAATTAVVLTRSVASGAGWRLSTVWAAYFGAGTLSYVVLHGLKRRTRLLEPVGDR